jgi:hypothetical protein
MALSDNAIGFFLEAENTTLSKTLAKATTDYEKYVKGLEKFNQRAFESTQSGLAKVEQLVKAVSEMPAATERAMKGASAKIGRELKPIMQKVDLAISVSSKAKLRRTVGSAVAEAMTDANVRLTATMPERRMALFNNALGLRAQYQQQVQPPDMRGKIRPLKKFAEGGVVDGPPGLDKVFAMLTKGEVVLPADVSKRLGDIAEGAQKKGGQIDERELASLIQLTDQYGDSLGEVGDSLHFVFENLNNITDEAKLRLSGAMLQATGRLEDLNDEGEESESVFERLFQKLLGPARFIAISQGFRDLRQGLNDLQAGAGTAFTTLGGDDIGSGIESINQMNQFLGVSRDRLVEIKIRAGQMAKEVDGITFDELGFGLKTAAEVGIRDEDVLFRLAKTSALAAKGLDVASESATKLGFELTESLNVSQAGFEATLGTMSQLSDATSGFNISAGKLFQQTEADVAVLNTSLQKLDDTATQRLLGSFNQIGAVLESNFIDNAAEIRQILAKAFEGGPENMEAIASATQLTGLAQDELRAKLLSGDLEGIFDRIGMQVQGLSPDQIKALSTQVGISSDDLGRFGASIDAINTGFDTAQTRIATTGEGLAILETRAMNNRTAFEKMQEVFTDNVASLNLFGISGAEALDFFKEFNITSLASVAILGKLGFSALKSAKGLFAAKDGAAAATPVVGRLFGRLGGVVGRIGPMLAGIAKAAGPIALVGAAVGALTIKAIDFHRESVGRELEANEMQARMAHMDPTRIKKSIERVQKQIEIDEAAGVVNPTKVALLERYNQQLAELEGHLKAKFGRGQTQAENIVQPPSLTAPVSLEEIAAFTNMPDMGMADDKLDENNMLMRQLVDLMREQVAQGRGRPAASATPATQGPSQRLSPFGSLVAGGEF